MTQAHAERTRARRDRILERRTPDRGVLASLSQHGLNRGCDRFALGILVDILALRIGQATFVPFARVSGKAPRRGFYARGIFADVSERLPGTVPATPREHP